MGIKRLYFDRYLNLTGRIKIVMDSTRIYSIKNDSLIWDYGIFKGPTTEEDEQN